MPILRFFLLGLPPLLLGLGCARGPREENIEVKATNDPLYMPRSILQRYAEGQALGSEVASFPAMVEEVRKTDPTRADILEKGLKEIEKSPGTRSTKAKELLQKLQPSIQ